MKSSLICFILFASVSVNQILAQSNEGIASGNNITTSSNATLVQPNDSKIATTSNEAQSAQKQTQTNQSQTKNDATITNTAISSNQASSANTISNEITPKNEATKNEASQEKPKKMCPIWQCDNSLDQDWCYQYNTNEQSIHAASINKNNSACYILNYFETGEQNLKKNKQGYPLNETLYFQQVREELCKGRNWQEQARCKDFCTERKFRANVTDESGKYVIKNLTDWECSYDKYIQNHIHSQTGLRNWEECDYDDQCSSKHCECVPNSQNSKGRCTISVYDDQYRYFWRHACEDRDVDINWEKNTCEDFIQILYAHITEALDQDKNLTCLSTFNDYSSLMKLHEEIEKIENLQFYGWIVAGIIVVTIFCVACCAFQKETIKHQYEKLKKHKSKSKPLLKSTQAQQA